MVRTWMVVLGVASCCATPAVAQNYGAGAPTVGIPNGLSGPGGTMTFSPAPAQPQFGGVGGEIGVGVGTASGRRGRGFDPGSVVRERPGVQSDQRR